VRTPLWKRRQLLYVSSHNRCACGTDSRVIALLPELSPAVIMPRKQCSYRTIQKDGSTTIPGPQARSLVFRGERPFCAIFSIAEAAISFTDAKFK
jgi:hypothetical protein